MTHIRSHFRPVKGHRGIAMCRAVFRQMFKSLAGLSTEELGNLLSRDPRPVFEAEPLRQRHG